MKQKDTSTEDVPDAVPEQEKNQHKQNTRKCMVYLLNGQGFQINVQRNANGSDLLEQVRELLDIIEFDYFGLYFEDSAHHKYWLEGEKSMKKQLKNSPWKFHFSVKFYPLDPSQLTEDISRYHMVLQLRDNIVSGSFCFRAQHSEYKLQRGEPAQRDACKCDISYTPCSKTICAESAAEFQTCTGCPSMYLRCPCAALNACLEKAPLTPCVNSQCSYEI